MGYTNKELAVHYGSITGAWLTTAELFAISRTIEGLDTNIQAFYDEHGSLGQLRGISRSARKTLQTIIERGPDAAREELVENRSQIRGRSRGRDVGSGKRVYTGQDEQLGEDHGFYKWST